MDYNKTYYLQQKLANQNIIFCFLGLITQSVLEEIRGTIREEMTLFNANEKEIVNAFTVMIEQTQNIIKYFQNNKTVKRSEIFILGKNKDGFFIESGNIISNFERAKLEEHLLKITSLNKKELKLLYKDKIRANTDNKNGAGLGFIDMARRASRPIDFNFSETLIVNELFFSIKVTI